MRILVSGCTETVRRVSLKHPDYLGHLVSPASGNDPNKFHLPWAADNGAFGGFNPVAFRIMLQRVVDARSKPLWVVVPDVVGDARATLELFGEWMPHIASLGLPIALVGQDGLEQCQVPWDGFQCFFIGGTTEWKLGRSSAELAVEAKRRGKLVHMGRVNSRKRLTYAWSLGCDSIDGRSWSAWGNRYLASGCRLIHRLQVEQPVFSWEAS